MDKTDEMIAAMVAEQDKANAKRALSESLKEAISRLNACLVHEGDSLMQHTLINLRSECEWCINQFCK